MRDLHARMLGAVLGGEGLQGVADLASLEAGGPVAIALPARGVGATSPAGLETEGATVEAEVDIVAGTERVGSVQMLAPSASANGDRSSATGGRSSANGDRSAAAGAAAAPAVDREEIARAAALAAVAELAVLDARDEVAHDLRASLIEDLREGGLDAAEVLRRGARLGCDLSRGALAVVAEIRSSKPRGAVAMIEAEWPGTLAELIGERVYALMPASEDERGPAALLDAARRLVPRLRSHGPAALSSFYPDPGELAQALREGELVLEVVRRDDRLAERIEAGAGDGVYRLLFRALISDPAEVRSFYEDTVAPLVAYDEQYRSDLLATLEAYLDHDCNMNATARAIFAHRHTVAYRLGRIRELSGLDPSSSADRERLGLGIKAYRILAPTLHR